MPELTQEIADFGELYRLRILSRRTRRIRLLGRKCAPVLMRTFLGIEVKMGRKRVTCPDLPTARYLLVFGELGMAEIHVPYDPSQTARVLPELERRFHRLRSAAIRDERPPEERKASLRRVYARIRRRLVRHQNSLAAVPQP